ncbi:MAG: hypothetical protein AAFN78_04805 [Pseudomonadota bacterium]
MNHYLRKTLPRGVAAGALLVATCLAAPAGAETTLGTASRIDHTDKSLAELQALLPPAQRNGTTYEIPNQLNRLTKAPERSEDAVDPLVSKGHNPTRSPLLISSFEGPSSDDNNAVIGGRVSPPDTNGDVGLEHAVSYVNLVWRVANKDGSNPQGPFIGNSFWAGFGGPCEANNNGDPIVIYDHVAGRWVFSQFAPFDGVQCFAISDGEDPTTGFTRFQFDVEPNAFNDYPKIGMWVNEDGSQSAYTYTGRNFLPQNNPAFGRDITAVLFDRNAMLSPVPVTVNFTTTVIPGGFNQFDGIQPGHVENGNVAPGSACPLFSVAQAPSTYRFFQFCENFPAAGSFSALPNVTVPTFDDGLNDVQVPGGSSLNTLSFFTMYRATHANINGEHQLAMAHTVDVGGNRGGMRWTILDVDNYNAITVKDTGTYAPNDGRERWMGAVSLDQNGNLGMAYTRAANNEFPSVFVTGREVGDPAGTLQDEVACVIGTGSQSGSNRWGDYSSTSLDPADQCTFYTFQEYVEQSGFVEWNTRVCAFRFPSCGDNPPVLYTLGDADPGVAGATNEWDTSNGTPNGFQLLYLGRNTGSSTINILGCSTTLGISNARLFGIAQGNADGDAVFSRDFPAQASGATLRFQAVDFTSCEPSNVSTTTFQ